MHFGRRDTRKWCWAALACLAGLLAFPLVATSAEPPAFNSGKWPFLSPVRPLVPRVKQTDWVANPVDAFILAKLEAAGLQANAPAEKLELLRRLSFDLTGLPPTPEEQQSFLKDARSDAYERLVDRLLDSPRYGERWAQHWLDVVRYAETDGFKEDAYRPAAHRYRDWVIRALNDDLPYDRFVALQLAGDELEPDNPDAWLATGLNRLYPDETNAANVRQRLQEIHDELTDTTALVFLGLTVGCAQCHDHKFDPITQVDYYRLQAFFAPMLPRDDVPLASAEERRRHAIDLAAWEEATAAIRQEMESLLLKKRQNTFADAIEKFEPEIRQMLERPDSERSCRERQLTVQAMKYVAPKMAGLAGKSLKGENQKRYEVLEKRLADFAHLKPAPLPTMMAASDAGPMAPATFRMEQGDFRKPAEEVQPGFPAFLGASEADPQPTSAGTSGRRAALARWLTRPDHPLASRVLVNRVWQHHFGVGIVATPNDFGAMGEPPSHADLLDWLAVEFVNRGWSLKQLHRLLVTSNTYKQSSQVDPGRPAHARAMEHDSGNRLLWHARRRRLEGEALRDAMLQLAGRLELRMFGESAKPELPGGVTRYAWKPDPRPEQRNRRSIYVFAKRNLRYPLFDLFDQPDLHNSCPKRSLTTTAPQALALLNGEFPREQARDWAARLIERHAADNTSLVSAAYAEAFGRQVGEEEQTTALSFLERQAQLVRAQSETPAEVGGISVPSGSDAAHVSAVIDFCHALTNANEFLYVD